MEARLQRSTSSRRVLRSVRRNFVDERERARREKDQQAS